MRNRSSMQVARVTAPALKSHDGVETVTKKLAATRRRITGRRRAPAAASSPMTLKTGPGPGRMHVLVRPQQLFTAPSFAALAQYTKRGSTSNFDVYFANSLGASGASLADAVLARCEPDFATLRGLFGGVNVGRFSIYIEPGSNGAHWNTSNPGNIFCDAFSGTDGTLENFLTIAEESEIYMYKQNRGWDPGGSNGEGLSRILATELYPSELGGFATASSWLNHGRPDWVSRTEPTDTNFVSTGCATLFINYLRHQPPFSFSLGQIIQAGGSTLAQAYTRLTGGYYPFERFALMLFLRFPPAMPAALANDNPFPITIRSLSLNGLVHLQGLGDYHFTNDNFIGTQGQSRRLEGFQIQFNPPVPNLGMRYMAHLQDVGDVGWVNAGQFIGTRGESRRLEGFAIQLTGSAAANYNVTYMAHVQNIGDTAFCQNGQFCGTRGQGLRVEGMLVHVGPK